MKKKKVRTWKFLIRSNFKSHFMLISVGLSLGDTFLHIYDLQSSLPHFNSPSFEIYLYGLKNFQKYYLYMLHLPDCLIYSQLWNGNTLNNINVIEFVITSVCKSFEIIPGINRKSYCSIMWFRIWRKIMNRENCWYALIAIQCNYPMNVNEYSRFLITKIFWNSNKHRKTLQYISSQTDILENAPQPSGSLWFNVFTWTIKASILSDWGQAKLCWNPLVARWTEPQYFQKFFLHPLTIKWLPRLTVRYL